VKSQRIGDRFKDYYHIGYMWIMSSEESNDW
jgi:hypothetical protein